MSGALNITIRRSDSCLREIVGKKGGIMRGFGEMALVSAGLLRCICPHPHPHPGSNGSDVIRSNLFFSNFYLHSS